MYFPPTNCMKSLTLTWGGGDCKYIDHSLWEKMYRTFMCVDEREVLDFIDENFPIFMARFTLRSYKDRNTK